MLHHCVICYMYKPDEQALIKGLDVGERLMDSNDRVLIQSRYGNAILTNEAPINDPNYRHESGCKKGQSFTLYCMFTENN